MSYVQKISRIFDLSLFLRNLIILAVIAVIKYKMMKMDKTFPDLRDAEI
jgi:hypothetical protein